MAYRRNYKKKTFRRRRKKYHKAKLGKPSRGLISKQSIYLFKRSFTEILDLGDHPTSNPYQPETLTGVFAQTITGSSNQSWTISPKITIDLLDNYADYQNLFTQYKLQGIKTKFYLTANPATAPIIGADGNPWTADSSWDTAYNNQPFLMDTWFNPTEVIGPATEVVVQQIQRRKTKVLKAYGTKYYCKLKQHVDLSLGTNTETGLEYNAVARSNKWIPLDAEYLQVPHYGATHWIRALSNTGTMPHMLLRMEHTIYVACRGVR